jgi:hypothetical protein
VQDIDETAEAEVLFEILPLLGRDGSLVVAVGKIVHARDCAVRELPTQHGLRDLGRQVALIGRNDVREDIEFGNRRCFLHAAILTRAGTEVRLTANRGAVANQAGRADRDDRTIWTDGPARAATPHARARALMAGTDGRGPCQRTHHGACTFVNAPFPNLIVSTRDHCQMDGVSFADSFAFSSRATKSLTLRHRP